MVVAWPEFKFAYYDVAVQRINHQAMDTSSDWYYLTHCWIDNGVHTFLKGMSKSEHDNVTGVWTRLL